MKKFHDPAQIIGLSRWLTDKVHMICIARLATFDLNFWWTFF